MKINKLFLTASFALCAAFMANAQESAGGDRICLPAPLVCPRAGWYAGDLGRNQLRQTRIVQRTGWRRLPLQPRTRRTPHLQRMDLKGSIEVDGKRSDWKWNYVAPTVNATVDLVNLIGGFNPERPVNAGIFAGIGANIAARNGEANDVNNALKASVYKDLDAAARPDVLRNIWTGTKARFVGQFGVYADYNLTSNLKLGLELQANVLPDGYNSKKAGNADWYFNGLVGVKYAFGTTFTKQKRKSAAPLPPNPRSSKRSWKFP